MNRDGLSQLLQPIQSELHRTPLLRAPRLCRLLRAEVDRGTPSARRELDEELLRRSAPLMLIMKPDGQSTFVAEFPGIGPALRAYPDMHSLQMTVRDLELAEDSYVPASMAVRDIFGWAAGKNLSVALNVYMTPYTPTYVMWLPSEAQLMAQGQHARITPDELHGLLSEADALLEQGLYERALGPLRVILASRPENLDAHERAYHLYVAMGNTRDAFEQLLNVLRLCTRRREVRRAEPYLAALLEQQPGHPEVPEFLAFLRAPVASA
jgi:tetratricopeptide (TPR) repeat protein